MSTKPIPTRPDGEPIPCRGCQYFTGPGCGCDNAGHDRPQQPGPRPGLDQISSEDLDVLWDRAENAEAEIGKLNARILRLTAERSLHVHEIGILRIDKEGHDAVSQAWARKLHESESKRQALHTAHVALAEQAGKDQAAIERVRAELHALNSEVRGLNPVALAGRRDAVARLRAALDEHQEQPPTT